MALTEREGGHACTGAGRRRTEEGAHAPAAAERRRMPCGLDRRRSRAVTARAVTAADVWALHGNFVGALCSDGMETTDRPARRRRCQLFFTPQLHICDHHPLPVCGAMVMVGLPSSETRKGYRLARRGIAAALPQTQRLVYVT